MPEGILFALPLKSLLKTGHWEDGCGTLNRRMQICVELPVFVHRGVI